MSGCPFGGLNATAPAPGTARPLAEANRGEAGSPPAKLPTGRARIRLLYEEYVHLPLLRHVWEHPSTAKPVLEPCFAAGMHGIELCFLLLAEFVADPRRYVQKRPRIEMVSDDLAAQCQLLTEVLDAELEEELQEGGAPASRLSLTQPFPFEGCPPTKEGPCHSPGLQRLIDAIGAQYGSMASAERNSLIRVIINITAAFASFQRWSVGLGIEHQTNALRAAVGLPEIQFPHRRNLDYDALVQPHLCEQTLSGEAYAHNEDFFFRTVHLGTDCWAFIALSRMHSAQELAAAGAWHVAAARATQAARILQYLGDHVLLLTSMNLRDYLLLKVELEGTSGEGSVQVKAFKPTTVQLFQPLAEALVGGAAAAAAAAGDEAAGEALHESLMAVYEWPDKPRHLGLYAYCKALECLETGVNSFYYKHYCLATNVIGTEARGTMRRAVQALKASFEAVLFPQLDRCRVGLGARIDAEVADRKGRMMEELLHKYQQRQASGPGAGAPASAGGAPGAAAPPPAAAGGCPFGHTGSPEAAGAGGGGGGYEAARRQLYSWEGVPPAFQQMVAAEAAKQAQRLGLVARPAAASQRGGSGSSEGVPSPSSALPLAFLDHAWGQLSPVAQYRAWSEAAALHQLGNPSWDALGAHMAQGAAHVKRLLGLPADSPACTVHFGSNSHELVSRLLSSFLDRLPAAAGGGGAAGGAPLLRVLTTDTEFYSITRQLNRLTEAGLAAVEAVPAQPAATFQERCCAAAAAAAAEGRAPDVIYLSQCTYLTQQTLVPNVTAMVRGLRAAVAGGGAGAAPAAGAGAAGSTGLTSGGPLIIVDGYHGFMALPTDLGEVAGQCCYVAGLLKHAGCGANCAFMTVPASLQPRPVLTSWLADPSVLAPGSAGITIGSQVGYLPEMALQGGTPSFALPLLTYNHLMALWQASSPAVTVEAVHGHVMRLHAAFLAGLDAAGHPAINAAALLPPQEESRRSHTLVFQLPFAAAAQAAVRALRERGVLVDCRKACVRFGFGANHSLDDVGALLGALQGAAASAMPAA